VAGRKVHGSELYNEGKWEKLVRRLPTEKGIQKRRRRRASLRDGTYLQGQGEVAESVAEQLHTRDAMTRVREHAELGIRCLNPRRYHFRMPGRRQTKEKGIARRLATQTNEYNQTCAESVLKFCKKD